MKQFSFLELSMFNFPISLDYKIDLRVYWFLSIMSISIFHQKTYKFLSNFSRITLSKNAKSWND